MDRSGCPASSKTSATVLSTQVTVSLNQIVAVKHHWPASTTNKTHIHPQASCACLVPSQHPNAHHKHRIT